MSFLEKKQEAFRQGLASVSSKRPAPVSPSPSIASNTSVAAGGGTPSKKPKRDPGAMIFSQPQNTGLGLEEGTRIVYAVDYVKSRGKDRGGPIPVRQVMEHLNTLNDEVSRSILARLKVHPRLTFTPPESSSSSSPSKSADDWLAGTFEFKPLLPGVVDKTSLIAFLQKRTESSGVLVKEIKDGWPDCEQAITELERANKLLVVRYKNAGAAKAVWIDDPTLSNIVEDDFRTKWHKVALPDLNDIVGKLKDVGQKPTSDDPRLLAALAPKEKKQKKRAMRRTGKTTNTHMEHLLKDYSQLKR